jgi:uncharacterized protein YodC (DUF2158 family)
MDIGDVVHLKSGGSAMTVSEIVQPGLIPVGVPGTEPMPMARPAGVTMVCMWHDEKGVPCVERYDERMLAVKVVKVEKQATPVPPPTGPSGFGVSTAKK